MKIVLSLVGVLVLLVAVVVVIGLLLPKRHVASRSAVLQTTPERLFGLISGSQEWRPDVKSCELIEKDGNHPSEQKSLAGDPGRDQRPRVRLGLKSIRIYTPKNHIHIYA